MSITDELRNCIRTANRSYEDMRNPCNDREILHIPEEELLKIADRIDAEHESACAGAYGNGVMSVPIALDESAWVKLPVDADGVPIRVGDELVIFETGALARAYDLELYEGGRWMVCDDEMTDSINPKRLRHRAKTVEDVLDKFANALFGCDNTEESVQRVIAEYAKRLRLAGDE